MLNLCALQLPTLPMSKAKLDYYFRICAKKNVALVSLGEYVLNGFFKEIEKTPTQMVIDQSLQKLQFLKELCDEYKIAAIAPIILPSKKGLIKSCAIFIPFSEPFLFEQDILISYEHWNEEAFFANKKKKPSLKTLMIDDFKVGIIFGFEAHFDFFWQEAMKQKVDLVVVPTASTFESNQRWIELLKIRAFTNNVYVLRTNRVGEYKDDSALWKFYGQSFLINPFGEVEELLNDKEEALICSIEKKEIEKARELWGFAKKLESRKMFGKSAKRIL